MGLTEAARLLPAGERLELVFRLWDELAEDGFRPEPDEELWGELDRRLDAHEADPADVRTGEQVRARLREPS